MKDNIKKVHLVLTYKWYDMIAEGIKTEEYREYSPRYRKMLYRATHIVFHRGYTKNTMEKEVVDITLGFGNPEWGAPTDQKVLIIQIK